MVGDRLDTDIEGAVTMGWDSLLVLTGVTGLEELVGAAKDRRPTYVGRDLGALAEPQTSPEVTDDASRSAAGPPPSRTAGSWSRATVPPSDWWRVVAVAAWRHLDDTGQPVETGDVQVPQ